MTRTLWRTRTYGGVCTVCGHDLKVMTGRSRRESNGKVYCSNALCRYAQAPYPTRSFASIGP